MLTEHARDAIVRAQAEGREMGHRTVQVEHLLLGLFSDQDGIAGRVFADIGLTVESIRDLVRERLGGGSAQDSFRDQAASLASGRTGCEAIRAARWLGTAGEPGRARLQGLSKHTRTCPSPPARGLRPRLDPAVIATVSRRRAPRRHQPAATPAAAGKASRGRLRLPCGYRGSALSSTVASRMAQELDRADPVALIGRCAGAGASEAQRGCRVGLDTLTFGESWHAVIVSVEAPVNSGSVWLGDEVDEDGGDPRPASSPEENHPNSTLSTRRSRACG